MNLRTGQIRQAVQTATAGVLAMYLSRYLGLPEGYWAAITAVIVLQASLGAALKESWVRVAATAIGAAVAIPAVTYFGSNLVAFGAALFVTVLLCSALALTAGKRVASTTVAIIILIPHSGRPWVPGIHRFLEVAFGIVVALVVAKFVWPSSAMENLGTSLASSYSQLDFLFLALMHRYRGEAHQDIEGLRAAVNAAKRCNDDLQEQASYEVVFRSKNPKVLAAMAGHADRICRIMDAIDVATQRSPEGALRLRLEPEVTDLSVGVERCLKQISESLSSKRSVVSEFDFQRTAQALDAKAAKLRKAPGLEQYPLADLLRLDAVCVALQGACAELAEAQTTMRGTIH